MMRPETEGAGLPGIVRMDENLAGHPAGNDAVPTAKADIVLARSPKQALKVWLRTLTRRAARTPDEGGDAVTREEDLTGNPLTATPTRDAQPIIARKDLRAEDPAAPDDPNKVDFAMRLQKVLELGVSVVTRRGVFIRAVAYLMLTAGATAAAAAIFYVGFNRHMTNANWFIGGGILVLLFVALLGMGLRFADRRTTDS